jgi:hypothetical protein
MGEKDGMQVESVLVVVVRFEFEVEVVHRISQSHTSDISRINEWMISVWGCATYVELMVGDCNYNDM